MTGDLDKIAPMSRERLAQELLVAHLPLLGKWQTDRPFGLVAIEVAIVIADALMSQLEASRPHEHSWKFIGSKLEDGFRCDCGAVAGRTAGNPQDRSKE